MLPATELGVECSAAGQARHTVDEEVMSDWPPRVVPDHYRALPWCPRREDFGNERPNAGGVDSGKVDAPSAGVGKFKQERVVDTE